MPAEKADYRLVYDQTRITPWTDLSTRTHTVWRFASQHSGAAPVPGRWYCGSTPATDDCSALGMLAVDYRLEQSLTGTVAPGPDSMVLGVHEGADRRNVPIDRATVSVSFDDGAHWTPTRIAGLGGNCEPRSRHRATADMSPRSNNCRQSAVPGAGRFRARWTNPASAAGGTVAFTITARDASGARVTQVVHDAVTVAAAGR